MVREFRFVAWIVLGLAVSAGCGRPGPSAPRADQSTVEGLRTAETKPPPPHQEFPPGLHAFTTRLESGENVRFAVLIPQGYSGSRPTPLILSLHYGGDVTPFYGGGMVQLLVNPALEELGAIIVAPDSLGGPWSSETNERAVLRVWEFARQNFNIDPNRTLILGYSRGGAGTWELGARHQNLFSAALPISARPAGPTKWNIPVYVIHSRDDGLIPLEPVEKHVQQLDQQGCDVTLQVVEGITHFETQRFVEPLKKAVPWIQSVWNRSAGESGRKTQ